jgi:hypothetical protein
LQRLEPGYDVPEARVHAHKPVARRMAAKYTPLPR